MARVIDVVLAFPGILLAIALMALTRASVENVVLAITIAEIPRVSRLVRGVVLSLREQPYVDAAIAAGTLEALLAESAKAAIERLGGSRKFGGGHGRLGARRPSSSPGATSSSRLSANPSSPQAKNTNVAPPKPPVAS